MYPLNISHVSQGEFGALVDPHRRELQAHCYRMLGSVEDAEDMVQETFLRAWQGRNTFEGRATLRAWLYRIATNACLDALKKRPRREVPRTRQDVASPDDPIAGDVHEPIWLEPYPDHLLFDESTSTEFQVVVREQTSLAFMVALHLLPPRQRAVLLLRDVLDWQANEVADLLELSISAVKSMLHRARTKLAKHQPLEMIHQPDSDIEKQLAHYVHAWETANVEAFVAILKTDATFSMPPIPSWYQGREAIGALVAKTIFRGEARGRWKLLPTRANGQIAFGLYRHDPADGLYQAYGIQVLTLNRNEISDVITFRVPDLVSRFDLPSGARSQIGGALQQR